MGAMETTGPIPVTLDVNEIAARLRFDPAKAGFESLDELVAFAEGLIKPRGVMLIAYVGAKGERTVEVAGVTFESPILRQNLEKANKVFPYVITIGPELERAAASQGDLLRQYYLEEMANIALEKAAAWLAAQTRKALRRRSALQHEPRLARGLAHHRADQALFDASAIRSGRSACA